MGKLKWIGLAALICLMPLLCGCAKRAADITVMDNFIEVGGGSETVNAPYARFDALLEDWREAHPSLVVEEQKRTENGDIPALAVLGAEHMPDVFMADGVLGRLLADNGLVLELTDYVSADDASAPFVYGDKVYAFPASAPSVSVLICEGSFPRTWTELYARQLGIAWGKGAAFDLLSPAIAANGADAWLDHMIAADRQRTFLDDSFVSALVEAIQARDSGLLVEMEPAKAIKAFLDRKYSAVLLNGENVYKLLDQADPQRRESLRFATLPGRPGEGYVPGDVQYGFFINAGVADDPEKTALCVDLCRHLSQAANAGRGEDPAVKRLEAFVARQSTCRNCAFYLNGLVWSQLENTQLSPLEIANNMQEAYERYYLNMRDVSALLDYYLENG